LDFGAGALAGGVWPLTKMRVNSPGADAGPGLPAGADGEGFTASDPLEGEEP